MDRREMLKRTAGMAGAAYVGSFVMPKSGIASTLNFRGNSDKPLYCGWAADPKAKAEFIRRNDKPFFSDHNSNIKGSGRGKVVLLHKFFEHVTGKPLVPHFQEIGDCLIAGSMVTMADGSRKPIERVTAGERVLTHLGRSRTVSRTIRKPYTGSLVRLKAENWLEELVSTPDHLIKTDGDMWKASGRLKLGEAVFIQSRRGKAYIKKVQSRLGLRHELEKVSRISKAATTVYCLDVVEDHSFIANGYTVHNCVSHAFGLGVDMLTAIRMTWMSKQERWLTKCATEIIYAGSRFEVGGGGIRGDGSMGVWAADFIRDWGVVLRKAYLDGKHDFTDYSGTLARELGRTGVPNELEPICKLHPVRTCSLVDSWEECRDSVANGHPVAMCSNIGFRDMRDNEGFLDRARLPWYHAMLIIAIDDQYKRPGALVQNSWGSNWVYGPVRHGQPAGSFWVDAEIIDIAMRQGDSVALSGYVGYPQLKTPDYHIF